MRQSSTSAWRSRARLAGRAACAVVPAVTAACGGVQSALAPAGRDAERIADLTVVMTVGATLIWAGIVALALFAAFSPPRAGRRGARALILGGGVVFPVVVLGSLLVFGMGSMRSIVAPSPDETVFIEVTGAQWWWRIRYHVEGRAPIDVANEIRLPVSTRLNVRLRSEDVIHSFWIPSIAGKIDMIPGRTNQIALEPTRTGTFRGACAEYCGSSHALMNLTVMVTDRASFDMWLDAQAQPAVAPTDATSQRGAAAFREHGCVTCHTVRGTDAVGVVGPDLTHVGSRSHIAAGLLPASPEEFARWIAHARRLKPDARMPSFTELPDDVLRALAAYLAQLT